jgi:hypothetical protein
MNPAKLKKIVVLIPTFLLAILLIRRNYNWIFGLFIGTALAFSSCELIQKAVASSFRRKVSRTAGVFLLGFFFRFILFAALLYFSILYFQVNVIAITVSFTVVQLLYPFYLIHTLERYQQHV